MEADPDEQEAEPRWVPLELPDTDTGMISLERSVPDNGWVRVGWIPPRIKETDAIAGMVYIVANDGSYGWLNDREEIIMINPNARRVPWSDLPSPPGFLDELRFQLVFAFMGLVRLDQEGQPRTSLTRNLLGMNIYDFGFKAQRCGTLPRHMPISVAIEIIDGYLHKTNFNSTAETYEAFKKRLFPPLREMSTTIWAHGVTQARADPHWRLLGLIKAAFRLWYKNGGRLKEKEQAKEILVHWHDEDRFVKTCRLSKQTDNLEVPVVQLDDSEPSSPQRQDSDKSSERPDGQIDSGHSGRQNHGHMCSNPAPSNGSTETPVPGIPGEQTRSEVDRIAAGIRLELSTVVAERMRESLQQAQSRDGCDTSVVEYHRKIAEIHAKYGWGASSGST